MKLYVKIVAISEEDGMKSTREELVEIPAKVLRLNEVVMGKDPAALLEGFAVGALAAAIQTVQIGGQSRGQEILTGTGAGPIGGRVGSDGQPAKDPLAESLGLDIIEAMDRKERGGYGPAFPHGEAPRRPAAPAPRQPDMHIGFGSHRGR